LMASPDERRLRWDELPQGARAALTNKLDGLYGQAGNESVFDALAVDKQQSLLLFARRLRELELWQHVERIENVYGTGGVGMNFLAQAHFASLLAGRPDFSSRFAVHRDCAEGFSEVNRSRAALHFLRMRDDARRWSVHFDLHAPAANPLSAFRHIWHEKLRRETPDWRVVKAALG
jgi:hypothetical protein